MDSKATRTASEILYKAKLKKFVLKISHLGTFNYLGLLGCFDEDLLHLLDGCSPVPPLTRVLAKENIEESYKKGHLFSSYLIGALPFLLWQGS